MVEKSIVNQLCQRRYYNSDDLFKHYYMGNWTVGIDLALKKPQHKMEQKKLTIGDDVSVNFVKTEHTRKEKPYQKYDPWTGKKNPKETIITTTKDCEITKDGKKIMLTQDEVSSLAEVIKEAKDFYQ